MSYRDTSLEAYKELTRLNYKQKRVFEIIQKRQPCTDQQISEALGWPINRVTPRRGELERKGIVVSAGKVKTSSGRRAHAWRLSKQQPGIQTSLNL